MSITAMEGGAGVAKKTTRVVRVREAVKAVRSVKSAMEIVMPNFERERKKSTIA
jgi:hypothetical protein